RRRHTRFSRDWSSDVCSSDLVAARARDRDHRGAAELVELGLVVLGDDLVFADGRLREGIAAAGVLAGDAAGGDVVLLADAIDERSEERRVGKEWRVRWGGDRS